MSKLIKPTEIKIKVSDVNKLDEILEKIDVLEKEHILTCTLLIEIDTNKSSVDGSYSASEFIEDLNKLSSSKIDLREL